MASARTRLTAAYAAALGATFLVFSLVLAVARGASADEAVRRNAVSNAELAVAILRQASAEFGGVLVVTDTLGRPQLRREVATRLAGLPEYVLVFDRRDSVMFNSATAARLAHVPEELREQLSEEQFGERAVAAYLDYRRFVEMARGVADTSRRTPVHLKGEHLLLVSRSVGGQLDRVVVGASTTWIAQQTQRELIGTVLVIAPILMLLSVALASLLAGRAFEPIGRLMNQLEAITDGRSLHRRLPVGEKDDEIARLTVTLNAMLGRLENYFGALRRFTADASHELKTPLAVLRADVERAMNSLTPAPERLEALEEALQETTRMADLVEQLLTLARADEGRFDLHREPVALEPLVRDVCETALILGETGGITVTMPVVEPATIMGDRARLRQLFLNLVTNAIKYTPRGGEVELSLRRAGDVVTFSVRDTGIGIAAADLPYIFDRFWRADRARSRGVERGGFGLGLAISQWIAQAHGGSLTAASRLTRGSVFTASLPLAPEGSTAEYAIPHLATAPAAMAADAASRPALPPVEEPEPVQAAAPADAHSGHAS